MAMVRQQRRGMAAVLAMLYLVLFSTLAIGFYAATTTASQLAANDDRIAQALLAAESGMDFIRYQLGSVQIPPGTPTTQVINSLFQNLQAQLNNTSNIGNNNIALAGNTISIPGGGNWIKLNSAGTTRFQATITGQGQNIVTQINGQYGNNVVVRSISMGFALQSHTTTVFNYAVASEGQIVGSKGTVSSVNPAQTAVASMLSVAGSGTSIAVSGTTVGGDLYYVNGAGVSVTGGSVADCAPASSAINDHIHLLSQTPQFPTVDTSAYLQYATNMYSATRTSQQNILVPPNTNPRFNGNNTVQGIMYIQSPNVVTFNGNFNLQGFIVFDGSGSDSVNSLTFSGNFTQGPVPSGAQFSSLQAASGVAILAPTAAVTMTGSAGADLAGNLIVDKFATAGAAAVDITNGTLMTLNSGSSSCVFGSSKQVLFSNTGNQNQPAQGLSYSTYYAPNAATYQELVP